MERWNIGILDLYDILLNNIVIHEINLSWYEKILIEAIKNSEFGKIRFPFTSWPVNYFQTFHSNSKRLLPTVSMLPTVFQEIFQRAIVDGH